MFFLTHNMRSTWLRIAILVLFLASCTVSSIESRGELPIVTATSTGTESLPKHSGIQRRVSLPTGLHVVAIGGQSIWISTPAEHSVSRIDVGTGKVIGSPIALDFEPREIAYGEGAVWVCSVDRTRLVRIDPQTNEVVAVIDLQPLQIPTYTYLLIAAGEGAVWLTSERIVIQIDPQTNQIVGKPLEVGESVIAVALGHGTLWTGSHDDGIIARVDPRTHSVVATIDMGFAVHGLTVSEESAWVLDEHGFGVVRVDPQRNQLQERIPIDFVGSNLAAGAGSVWVAPAARDSGQSTGNDGITRIHEIEKQIVDTIHVGGESTDQYYSVLFREGSVWVAIDAPQMTVVQIVP